MLHIPSNFYYPIYYEQNDTSRGIMLKSLQGGSIIITECLMKIRPFISSWNLVVVIASTLHPPLMLHLQIWLPTLQLANNLTQLEGYFKTVINQTNNWAFTLSNVMVPVINSSLESLSFCFTWKHPWFYFECKIKTARLFLPALPLTRRHICLLIEEP